MVHKMEKTISFQEFAEVSIEASPGWGVLPYMGHIGMCRCEGYGFQAVYSSIGYINQSFWDWNMLSFFTKLTSWLKILSRLRKSGIYSSTG